MNKLLLIFLFTLLKVVTFAQTINYGIKGGFNLSNQSLTDPNVPNFGKNLAGFNIGGIIDVGYQNFSIQSGIFYSTKGEKFVVRLSNNSGMYAGTSTIKFVLNYIEVPVNFLYKIRVAPGTIMHLGGGPYFGYGISVDYFENGKRFSDPNSKNSFESYYKNPDFGINFIAGVIFKNKFLVDAGYGLGLADLSGGNSMLQNRVISFSVGYLFR